MFNFCCFGACTKYIRLFCFGKFGEVCFGKFGEVCFGKFGEVCFGKFGEVCFGKFGEEGPESLPFQTIYRAGIHLEFLRILSRPDKEMPIGLPIGERWESPKVVSLRFPLLFNLLIQGGL
jgi:hypothetical protein